MMTLYEKGIPFTKRLVNINLGEQFHDDFLTLSPRAEVPILRDVEYQDVYQNSSEIVEFLEFNFRRERKSGGRGSGLTVGQGVID